MRNDPWILQVKCVLNTKNAKIAKFSVPLNLVTLRYVAYISFIMYICTNFKFHESQLFENPKMKDY